MAVGNKGGETAKAGTKKAFLSGICLYRSVQSFSKVEASNALYNKVMQKEMQGTPIQKACLIWKSAAVPRTLFDSYNISFQRTESMGKLCDDAAHGTIFLLMQTGIAMVCAQQSPGRGSYYTVKVRRCC